MTRLRLELLNSLRWLKEYIVSWAVLSAIYSLTVTLVLQPILERALKTELKLLPLWVSTCGLLLIPGALERLPLPALSVNRSRLLRFMPERIFGESVWSRLGGPLAPLYLRHEFRRVPTWLMICVSVVSAGLLAPGKQALWVLFAQLPAQRALYSVNAWRGLALSRSAQHGATWLLRSLWMSQIIQVVFCWLAVGWAGFLPHELWLALGPASLGAALAGSAVALEGDSGRPWLVNFMSLAAGTLGGYLCLLSPGFLILVLYFCSTCQLRVQARLLSVEHLDEDHLVS
jgi:hypothetical protein